MLITLLGYLFLSFVAMGEELIIEREIEERDSSGPLGFDEYTREKRRCVRINMEGIREADRHYSFPYIR